MFVSALRIIDQFTFPVIISTRHFSGEVKTGCGTFIILNSDGWVLTAGHIMAAALLHTQHQQEIAKFESDKARLESDTHISAQHRKKGLAKLQIKPDWITDFSYWWGKNGLKSTDVYGNEFLDIAITRLEPFDPSEVKTYPIFWNPNDVIPPGTSLCKQGFPFHSLDSTFDSSTKRFTLAPGSIPMPRFPLDGIHTRIAKHIDPNSGQSADFIEVSTPGLKGQSGGPVFDVEGRICGVQSHTRNLPLGFSPEIERGGRKVVENQFINLGYATHVKEVLAFLQTHGVNVTIAPPS